MTWLRFHEKYECKDSQCSKRCFNTLVLLNTSEDFNRFTCVSKKFWWRYLIGIRNGHMISCQKESARKLKNLQYSDNNVAQINVPFSIVIFFLAYFIKTWSSETNEFIFLRLSSVIKCIGPVISYEAVTAKYIFYNSSTPNFKNSHDIAG